MPTSPALARRPLLVTVAWSLFLAGMFGALEVLRHHGVRPDDLTQDPANLGRIPLWKGSLSTLGCMAWAAGGAACLAVAAGLPADGTWRKRRQFLLVIGVFALLLGVDDALQLHVNLIGGERYGSEKQVYAAYLVIGLAIVVALRDQLRRSAYPLLAVAASGLIASTLIDAFGDKFVRAHGWMSGAEDTFKLWGLAALTLFAFREARTAVREASSHTTARVGPSTEL